MEFIENEFEPKNESLKDLKAKIIKKGLSFHPYLAMQAINQEVETQAKDLVTSHFKGMSIEMLGKCNAEIKEYAEAEEARWQAFQSSQAKDKLVDAPVALDIVSNQTMPKIKTKKK